MTAAGHVVNGPDTPIVVDPVYDDDATPDVKVLGNSLPLKRPHVRDDKTVDLTVVAAHDRDDDQPKALHAVDLEQPPFSHAGRLNVHWSSADRNVHGSAQFIGPRLVLTAAHCVRWCGQWNRNLYFLRRYHRGVSAGPVLKVAKIGILKGWLDRTRQADPDEAAWRYDIAVLKIAGDDEWGYTPVAPLTNDITSITSFGYPGDIENGEVMLAAQGRRTEGRYSDTVGLHPSPMGFGASGGGWFVADRSGPRIVGLNSYKMSREPNTDYSPVIGKAALGLIARMAALD